MEWIILVSVWLVAGIIGFGLPAYLKEKGANLARREDIAELTRQTESVRQEYARELEGIKALLSRQSEALVRRRDVYHKLTSGLRVFVAGHQVGPDETKRRGEELLAAYFEAWLWAPDEVILAVNDMIDLNLSPAPAPDERQKKLRATLVRAILEMRRDVGFEGTELREGDFRFARL